MEEKTSLAHSLSVPETQIDQNQNESSPTLVGGGGSGVKEPSSNATSTAVSPWRTTTRLTKSTSWFNTISRRASRKTPTKKRSFAAFSSQSSTSSGNSIVATAANDSFTTGSRPRLNKSDWDVRGFGSGGQEAGYGGGKSIHHLSAHHHHRTPSGHPLNNTSRSTDCLDLENADSTADFYPDMSTLDLSTLDDSHHHPHHRSMTAGSAGNGVETENMPPNGVDGGVPAALYYTIDSRRLASKHKKSLRERKLWNGVKQFNLDPERGLKYLQEFGFIKSDAESVAKFLFRQERLSKKQIGKYLGSHHDFNREVLKHFVECHEFSQLLLVQALRQFLWSFRLPGEAMQIDRVMDAFAQHYCKQNPYIFQEPDTCFILSFSIIMLNTALHNPNAKMKITVEQFIKQNKGIDSGKDLPPDMQEAIFRNIKEEPFKIPDETYDDLMYTFFSPEREGWLLKQGGSWKTWKRRWFVLNDRCLYYFQHTAENVPKGIIPLENVRVRAVEDVHGKEWAFEIYSERNEIIKGCKTDSSGTVVQGNHKYYRMCAANEEDRDEWIEAIQDSIRDNPFHKIIAEKKANIRRRSGGSSSATAAANRNNNPAAKLLNTSLEKSRNFDSSDE
eukprot:TRINITY_DN9760_c0_g1_i7.p1 TRINITY_DN9760_c0_g1~~TRINITY_DN9760_c0_g1_i7.p1  ORF type:complete len:616 (-),score=174.90 TRINITY_DN9760_c0_g1_i7:282-2129(-)